MSDISPSVQTAASFLLSLENDLFDKYVAAFTELNKSNKLVLNFTPKIIGLTTDREMLEQLAQKLGFEGAPAYKALGQIGVIVSFSLKDINANQTLSELFKEKKERLQKIRELKTQGLQDRFYFHSAAKTPYFSRMEWEINKKEYPRDDIPPIKTVTIQLSIFSPQADNENLIFFECEPTDISTMMDVLQKIKGRLQKVK